MMRRFFSNLPSKNQHIRPRDINKKTFSYKVYNLLKKTQIKITLVKYQISKEVFSLQVIQNMIVKKISLTLSIQLALQKKPIPKIVIHQLLLSRKKIIQFSYSNNQQRQLLKLKRKRKWTFGQMTMRMIFKTLKILMRYNLKKRINKRRLMIMSSISRRENKKVIRR